MVTVCVMENDFEYVSWCHILFTSVLKEVNGIWTKSGHLDVRIAIS